MKYKVFSGMVVVEVVVLMLLIVAASLSARQMESGLSAKRELVKDFMLTDLALWTETRYTRHPSQADLFTPFQDFPSAIEHFPAGSIVVPPMISYSDSHGSQNRYPTRK
jgi:hypothetical protein